MLVVRSVFLGVRGHLVHRFAEWLMATQMVVFGLKLHAADDTFASSHSYDYMAQLAGENTWADVLIFIAACRYFALAANGTVVWFRPFSPAVRTITAWLSSATWVTLSYSMYRGNVVGTGWTEYGVLACADVFLAIVIAKEAGGTITRHMTNAAPGGK